MKQSLKQLEIAGIIFTIILGTLSHFFYQWSGENVIVGFISPVNESVWEHLKMLVFPYLFFSFIEKRVFRDSFNNFWSAKCIGLLLGIMSIVLLFYVYTSIFGTNYLAADIFIFIFSIVLSYIASYWFLSGRITMGSNETFSKIIILFIILLFILFTF